MKVGVDIGWPAFHRLQPISVSLDEAQAERTPPSALQYGACRPR